MCIVFRAGANTPLSVLTIDALALISLDSSEVVAGPEPKCARGIPVDSQDAKRFGS